MTVAKKDTTGTTEAGPQIIRLINDVRKKAGALEKTKGGLSFPFRGIDGTVDHLAPHLNEAGIVTVPQVIESDVVQRERKDGRIVTTTNLRTKVTFYAPDGSFVESITAGQADDFGDRSAAQAQSVALRVALLQTFFLPTQTADPEHTGQEVQNKPSATVSSNKIAGAASKAQGGEREAQQTILNDYINAGKLTKEEAATRRKEIQNTGSKTPYGDLLAALKEGK